MELRDLDLFIRFTVDEKNKYVVDNFNYTYELIIKFEDWTRILGSSTPRVQFVAEYVHPGNLSPRLKWQADTLDELIEKVWEWNESHREGEKTLNH